MNVELRSIDDDTWDIVDLLGRYVGKVTRSVSSYSVAPIRGQLVDLHDGPFPSLDALCLAVGRKVRGRCLLVPDPR